MKKSALLLLTFLFGVSVFTSPAYSAKKPFGYDLEADINRKPEPAKVVEIPQRTDGFEDYKGEEIEAEWESDNSVYYPNATLQSAVEKYQLGNYSGCLQEMISLTKIDPANPIVYYYMGMAYTQVGNKEQAIKAYEAVIKLNAERTLSQYALRGRDCLVGGETCSLGADTKPDEALIEFVNSPYGNGFSNEINKEQVQKELDEIQEKINNDANLKKEDIKRIQRFDEKSSAPTNEKISSDVTDEDVLAAIETLKKAGVTLSVNPYQSTPIDNEYSQLSMLLGNNNNNNNSMMNMLPYFMEQNKGQNLNPQLIQSMMMNSMITDFTFSDNDKK